MNMARFLGKINRAGFRKKKAIASFIIVKF
jgi:hypothetical protein